MKSVDEALQAAEAILSLLHCRGISDTEDSMQDVCEALLLVRKAQEQLEYLSKPW